MKREDILKKCKKHLSEIKQVPALSCVEYYFIAWLKRFCAVEKLYPQTILSYAQAEGILRESSFENPKGIFRIQEIAENSKIVVHEKRIYAGEIPKENELLLLRVTPDYFRGKQVAWREDHYVQLIAVTDKKFYVVNEYPSEVREFQRKDTSWMQGECLLYRFLADDESPKSYRFALGAENKNPITMEGFRDTLLIYRVCLKRLQACRPQDEILAKLISYVEMVFFRSALATKKNPSDTVLSALWRQDILKAEKEYIEMSKEKRERL